MPTMTPATKLLDGHRVPAWQAFTGRVTQSDIHRHGSYEAARQAIDSQRVVAAKENG